MEVVSGVGGVMGMAHACDCMYLYVISIEGPEK